jgi:7-cyano-7-deazaguanine synthase in queuosine biosynthesis
MNIVIIVIILYIIYKYRQHVKYKLIDSVDITEYNLTTRNNIKYVCWTGGFDSTFIVCNYISKGYTVQPIYLDFKNLDDIYIPLIQTKRNNSKIEIKKIEELTNLINNKFKAHSNLLPTKIIKKQKPNRNILEIMSHIHTKYNLFTRKTNQYERIIEVAYHYKTPLEIGVQKSTSDDFYRLKKMGLITETSGNYEMIKRLPSNYKLLGVLKALRFPIVELSKHDMLAIAKQNRFDDILKQTWSCWFPVYKNKKHYPCGKCYMCKERII